MNDRQAMDQALKEVFVPVLREAGFKGTLPHFRRVSSDRVAYLSVQFYSSGGSFVVELARAGPDGKRVGYGSDLPVEKLNVQYFTDRLRLGSAGAGDDHWYVFGPRNYEPQQPLRNASFYSDVAQKVVADFKRQAESWLATGDVMEPS